MTISCQYNWSVQGALGKAFLSELTISVKQDIVFIICRDRHAFILTISRYMCQKFITGTVNIRRKIAEGMSNLNSRCYSCRRSQALEKSNTCVIFESITVKPVIVKLELTCK